MAKCYCFRIILLVLSYDWWTSAPENSLSSFASSLLPLFSIPSLSSAGDHQTSAASASSHPLRNTLLEEEFGPQEAEDRLACPQQRRRSLYLGCYQGGLRSFNEYDGSDEEDDERPLFDILMNQGPFDQASCRQACDTIQAPLFGLTNGGNCLCHYNDRVPSVRIEDKHCNMPCTSNTNQTCGGSDSMSVYGGDAFSSSTVCL
jgi:hypothetical protein